MHANAPETIGLVYRQIGQTHVFTAKNVKGLVHIGSRDRKKAFEIALSALGAHVEVAYSVKAAYTPNMSYEEFSRHLELQDDIDGNFLSATLASRAVAC